MIPFELAVVNYIAQLRCSKAVIEGIAASGTVECVGSI